MLKAFKGSKFFPIILITLGLFVMVVSSGVALTDFFYKMYENELRVEKERISEIAVRNSHTTINTFNNFESILTTVAKTIEQYDVIYSAEVIKLLNDVLDYQGGFQYFESMYVVLSDGRCFSTDGKLYTLSEHNNEHYLDRLQEGNIFYTGVYRPQYKDGTAISINMPLKNRSGEYFASLACSISTECLSKYFSQHRFDGLECFHLVDAAGGQIAGTQANHDFDIYVNYYNALQSFAFHEREISDVFLDISQSKDDFIKFSKDDKVYYAYYRPVGMNNWYMFSVVEEGVVYHNTVARVELSVKFTIFILLPALLIFYIVYYLQVRSRREVELERKSFVALAQQYGDAIYEIEVGHEHINADSALTMIMGTREQQGKKATGSELVYKEDLGLYQQLIDEILLGNSVKNIKLRANGGKRNYYWTSLTAVMVKDHKNNPHKIIGIVKNIDEEERTTRQLIKNTRCDMMTGLLNKVASHQLIEEAYHSAAYDDGKLCALILIDIDNFKTVNDTLGHQMGDRAIVDVARRLKNCFRDTDILGRVGGDEFIVFAHSISDVSLIENRAHRLNSALRLTYEKDGNKVDISVSIGIALTKGQCELGELYKRADDALYHVKRDNKDSYFISPFTD